MSIEFIFVEAAKTLVQGVRITFLLFWWLGIGIVSLYRRVKERMEENQVRGRQFRATGSKSSAVACTACGATNEAGEARCFACGVRL
jgi:hypothetical protein